MKKNYVLVIALMISLSIVALMSTTSEAQTVNPSKFVFSVISNPQVAGRAFSITITAKASNGNTVTSYTGVNTLSVSSGTITPTTTTAFVAGVWTGQVALSQAGTGISISTSGGGKSGTSNTFTVNPGPLNHFTINTITSPQTAGKTFSITITAKDANSNTVTSYTGTNTLASSIGTISPTSTSAFAAGVWKNSVSLSASGSDITISTSGSSKLGTSNPFTVNPGSLDHFEFDNIGTQTVGDAFTITINAKDLNGNTVTTYTGTNSLTASSGSINPTSTGKFNSGVWTGQVTLSQAATGNSISTNGGGKSGKSNTFNVNALTVDHFVFNTISSPRTAGEAFSVTITAKAANGNTVTTYTGVNTLSVSSGTISPTSTTAFIAGVWTGQVALSKTGTGISISTIGAGKSGTSNTFTVNPGPLNHFTINTITSPQTAGSVFNIAITAKDQNNNTVTNYTGKPSLTCSSGSISPNTVNAFINGVASTSVIVNTAGSSITITVTDGTHTSNSNSFTVNPIISASAGAGGTISPAGNVSVTYGGSQSFSITANSGYHIVDVAADNVSLGPVSTYTFTNVQAIHKIIANFDSDAFKIFTSAGDGGSIAPNGSVSVSYGSSKTFNITADPGFYIVDILINETSVGTVDSYTFTNIQASYTISATFAPIATPTPTPTPTSSPTNPPVFVPTPTPTPKTTPIPSPTQSPTPTPLATVVPTTTDNGVTFEIQIIGNITASQISNATITSNQTTTTILSFTITGPNATTGFANMTIPKTAIEFGINPIIYIDGQPALNMGYTEDAENFYVWYTTQFSTHQVAIQFQIPSTLQDFSFASIFAIAITIPEVILVYTIIAIKRLRRKPENV